MRTFCCLFILLCGSVAMAQNRYNGTFTGNGGGLTNVNREYIATAYGVTNSNGGDTTAALNALLGIPGARVRVPADPVGYTVGNLHVTNGVSIINEGSIWSAKANTVGAILDMHSNTNIWLKGVAIKGLTSSNYPAMTPTWEDVCIRGVWYNNEGTLRGINCNMDGNIIEDCTVYDTSGAAFFPYNVYGGTAEYHKLTVFRGNRAINCYVGMNLNALTNAAPNDVAEYNLLSGFNATGCLYGTIKGAGNNRIENSNFSHNGIGILVTGGNNSAHGLVTSSINHNVYPVICTSVANGENFANCNIMANTGPIVVDASAGVVFQGCQFNQAVSMVITNSRAGVITTGTVLFRNNNYFGLYKDWTIQNAEGSKFVHYANYSSDNPGDTDLAAPQWPTYVWPLRAAFPLTGSFNDNSHGPSGSSIWDSVPSIQFGTNAGGFRMQVPSDPFYTNTITRFDFIGDYASATITNCTFNFFGSYMTNTTSSNKTVIDSAAVTFTLKADSFTSVFYTNYWTSQIYPRQITGFAPTVPGAYGSTKFYLINAQTEGRN